MSAQLAISSLTASARTRLAAGDARAMDLSLSRVDAHAAQIMQLTGRTAHRPASVRGVAHEQLRRLAQLWLVLAALYRNLVSGKKLAQRELWYRLKPLGIFTSPQQVYDRVSESGAIIAEWTGKACPREALGVIAAPRGSMTGTVSLATPDGPRQLDDAVYAIPGDPEECSRLRFASSRARYVVVVEKDTVFTRLLDDRFTRLLPCLLITACGYPSLAVRALVQHVVKALALPCVVLTDYNPHGMALMLCYKHGSATFAMDGYCCPELKWVGLHTADVQLLETPTAETPGRSVLAATSFQPYSDRDGAIVDGLLRNPVVANNEQLRYEAEAMRADRRKLELEALHALGPEFFAYFLRDKIISSCA